MRLFKLMLTLAFVATILVACSTHRHKSVTGKNAQLNQLDRKPEYPGGIKGIGDFLSKNIVYPPKAIAENKEGNVIVRFVVDTFGNVSNVTVVQPVDPLLDNEAIRVISLMNGWQPAVRKNGEKAAVYYTQPVTFRLTSK